jgi:predicted ATPase
MDSNRFVVISGCSGGGKSTLLSELARRGFVTIEEPGRRIVRQELLGEGLALPWVNQVAFVRRAITLSVSDRTAPQSAVSWVFLDRGLVDAIAALQYVVADPGLAALGQSHRYYHRVFFAPPWPEIYVTDSERRHDFNSAVAEYHRLLDVYSSFGYEITVLPKISVPERADFILHNLAQ